ncbi:MAG: acetyl-CoA C-acetyltransferase [Acidimicrobiia bacterium]|nr:acetyl-CoA C-acetyltransferase [Acidimicrobiia bacterium]MDH5503149.1 acetyl-CoA C-acetyltransferase [Acidimicrobiia bacterium]
MTAVIAGAKRTPIGKFGGGLASVRAVDLGATAIRAALGDLDPQQVDEVIFGQVLQAGEGQITARQAAVLAGLPMTVPSLTINKVCLSGLAAIGMANRSVLLGESKFVVAGGMESMSNAPYVMPKARWGARLGDAELIDVMMHDGLYCSFDQCSMGSASDIKNDQLGIGRVEQDAWSARSHERAEVASRTGIFTREIAPVAVTQRRGEPVTISEDEGIRPGTTADSLAALRPAFGATGTLTAGNSSQISDGGAAVIVADRQAADAEGLEVLAEIRSYAQVGGVDPSLHERPAEALALALKRSNLNAADLHAVEINEAFASVALWSARMLELPEDRVNVNGGAVALGHPIGATGARLVVTLINALKERGGGLGAVTLCGGGGQGDAMVLEVPA